MTRNRRLLVLGIAVLVVAGLCGKDNLGSPRPRELEERIRETSHSVDSLRNDMERGLAELRLTMSFSPEIREAIRRQDWRYGIQDRLRLDSLEKECLLGEALGRECTGVIVDARGLDVDSMVHSVYSSESHVQMLPGHRVSELARLRWGPVAYLPHDADMCAHRLGEKPIVLKAVASRPCDARAGWSEWIISEKDAYLLGAIDLCKGVLEEGRVAVIWDASTRVPGIFILGEGIGPYMERGKYEPATAIVALVKAIEDLAHRYPSTSVRTHESKEGRVTAKTYSHTFSPALRVCARQAWIDSIPGWTSETELVLEGDALLVENLSLKIPPSADSLLVEETKKRLERNGLEVEIEDFPTGVVAARVKAAL